MSNPLVGVGRALGESMRAALISPRAVQDGIRREQAEQRGRCLGLTDEQTGEVIDAWTTRIGRITDWQIVDDALVRRAFGEEWSR